MKLHAVLYWLFGAVMFLPLSIEVAGTELFFVQQFTAIVLLLLLVATRRIHRFHRLCALDQFVGLYFGWIILSYLTSAAMAAYQFRVDIELRRNLSLFMTCSLMAGYLLGRSLKWSAGIRVVAFNAGLIATYAFSSVFYLGILYKAGLSDLFLAREAIGQRIPMVIAYGTVICFVSALFNKRMAWCLYSLSALGLLLVGLSLTRAAYIQLLASGLLVFCYISLRNRLKIGFIAVLLAVAFLLAAPLLRKDGGQGLETVTQRFMNITQVSDTVEHDASGGFRVAMWRAIMAKLSENPVRWLVGYGSLGPASVVEDVSFKFGEVKASSAHSQYMDILVREGLVGLFLFSVVIFKMITLGLVRARRMAGETSVFVFAHSAALVGVVAFGFFHETVRYPIFGVFFWIYAGSLGSLRTSNTHSHHG